MEWSNKSGEDGERRRSVQEGWKTGKEEGTEGSGIAIFFFCLGVGGGGGQSKQMHRQKGKSQ